MNSGLKLLSTERGNRMCQTQQLFVSNNRFTEIVARVAFTACLHVNVFFAPFKSLTICPRPQQETAGRLEETRPPRSQRRKGASFLFSSNHIHQIVLVCDRNSSSCLVCCSLWPRLGACTRWKPPERRRAWRCLVCCRWKQSVKMMEIKISLVRQ